MSLCSDNKIDTPWHTPSPFHRHANTPEWSSLRRHFGGEGGRRISPNQVSCTPSSLSDGFWPKMCMCVGEVSSGQIKRYLNILTNHLGDRHSWNARTKTSFRSLQKVSTFISTLLRSSNIVSILKIPGHFVFYLHFSRYGSLSTVRKAI